MNTEILRKNLQAPRSRKDIIKDFCSEKDVLDIGCIHHDLDNVNSDQWIHGYVTKIARSALGVDYLEAEVKLLSQRGYRVILGDVNFPLPINEKFEVIVVGNLIEHLSSFAGLMENINNLLTENGVALISTANPFFREQYFYSALKNDIIVNPEHTCWIDPVTLDQLSRRFGLQTTEVLWVKEKWKLSEAYFNGKAQSLDTFTGRWYFKRPPTVLEKLSSPLLMAAFRLILSEERRKRIQARYQNEVSRMLYLQLKCAFLEVWWRCRRIFIPNSHINQHELFVSVLRRS